MPILATKLYLPPPRPRVVLRPRLVERLNEGLHGKLTLICAPAGFGKTTLVSEWLAGCARSRPAVRAGWLALDPADSNLTRFLTYLVAALRALAPQIGERTLAELESPQLPASEVLLTGLINEIAAVPHDFVLVLDDYHSVDAKAVDDALAFLLEHLPPHLHLVITTREDPLLPVARLRARGQLTELRSADLRFTPAEAADFLKEVMGLELAPEEVAALEMRTEGWIAGLQLAALSMRGRTDVAGFVRAFAGDNRYIVDYLVDEVLARQPAHVRSFLLQTSILDRLTGPLCDAVTGQHGGAQLLDTLERGNLFVVPLDDRRHWYRYHHLFADVLAAHALQEQPAQVPILHQRASAWYADNGMPAAAIGHALAAKDFARAADLIELAWPAMDGRLQSATWLGWAQALPDDLVRQRPVLSLAYAWALLNGGALEPAEARLSELERWLDRESYPVSSTEPEPDIVIVDKAQFRTLPASLATARAFLTMARGDLGSSAKYSQRALDLLPVEDHLRRGPAAALLSLAQWANGDLESAYNTLAEAMANFQKVGSLNLAISGTYGLADMRVTQGRLREAVKVYSQVLGVALAQGEPPLRGTAELYLGLSELYLEQGDLSAATEYLLKSEAMGEQAGLADWHYRFLRAKARFKAVEGDLAGALDLLDAAVRYRRPSPVPNVRPLEAMKARIWAAQGRFGEAQRWVQEQALSLDDELSYLREFEHITLARVLMAECRRDPAGEQGKRAMVDAMRLLDRLEHAAEIGGRMGSVIEISVLQALFLQLQGTHLAQSPPAAALAALQRALTLAEPEGYIRIFVDEGPPMASLLSGAAAQGIMPGYVGKLLAVFPTASAPARPGKAGLPYAAPAQLLGQRLIEPLSARELEVLQLIAQGFSNEAIGARLFLALSTVKGHNRNIFEKLQVQSRTEAVARARELGLL
ncbi:MAG: LuxR C-terminal-related transcriptional regulator [Caldilineaceae bacterium]